MFLLSRRQVHAALAGATAAVTYLAAAEIGSKRPVRVGSLFLLSSAALAGIVAQGTGNRASAKAYDVERRLNQFFTGGGQVGGTLYVNGDHHVSGDHYVTGHANLGSVNTAGDVLMNNHNISNVSEINTDGNPAGFHGPLYMNGQNLHMQGGSIIP